MPNQHPTGGLGNNQSNWHASDYTAAERHEGLDIGGGSITLNGGTISIYSATGGTVGGRRMSGVRTGELDPRSTPGNYVYIKDRYDGNIWYGHMRNDSTFPKTGDVILPGQRIGIMGKSGFSGGNHLHIEWQPNNGNWYDEGSKDPSELIGDVK